jgi:uncharacterized protein with NRDE domain
MPIRRSVSGSKPKSRFEMCTVSYLPLPSAGYILTSNRDEAPERPTALPINHYRIGERTVYFPKDPQAGGTWIATTGDESTICLLNGGFVPHIAAPGHHYRKSRGMVVLDYFLYAETALRMLLLTTSPTSSRSR